jgi:hypothetical protein
VHVKAAARLGINRNTLHKKVGEFAQADSRGRDADGEPGKSPAG